MKCRLTLPSLCSLVLAISLAPAFGATVIWDGGGADNGWSTGNNWDSNTVPTTATPFDDVQFAGSVRTAVNVDTDVTVKTLKFNSGASAFDLSGTGTITVNGQGTGSGDSGLDFRNESSALQTINNKIILGSPGVGFRAVNGDLTFNGEIDMTAATNIRFLGAGSRVTTFNGELSGTGGGTMAFNSGGIFVLNAVNSYAKNTSIWTATVKVNVDAPSGANGAFGNATSSISMGTTYDGGHLTSTMLTTNAVTIGRSITLASTHVNRAGDPHIYTIGGETAQVSNYTGTIFNSNNSGTKAASKLTVTAASGGRVNISNIVRGTGAVGDADDVVKTGAGIVAITGVNNDWQGNTLVQSGAFLVNGSVLTSPSGKNVQVSAGATLGGMGTLSRDVELASTAILSPGDMDASGNSLGGTLTLGDGIGLSLSTGTLLNFDLAAAGSLLDDEVSIIGDLVLAGLLNVNDLGGFGTGEYKLFSWTGSLTYTPGDLTFGDMPSGYDYAIDTTTYANSAYLVVTPEPSRMILLLAGLGVICFGRRRK